MVTEKAKERAQRRRWADVAIMVVGAITVSMGMWAPPMTRSDQAHLTGFTGWWLALFFAGALAFFSPFIALRSTPLARIAVVVAAVILLSGLAVFRAATPAAIGTLLVPALVLLAAAPFMGRMPTPEEEGMRR